MNSRGVELWIGNKQRTSLRATYIRIIIPFLVCYGSFSGADGDHLMVSDGKEWHYSEALHESNYPAVRVESGGVIQTQRWTTQGNTGRCIQPPWPRLRELHGRGRARK